MNKLIKIFTLLLLLAAFSSCGQLNRWRQAHTPPDDGCIHCHYTIYKDWKIAYRPYNEAAKTEDYTPVHSRPMSAADVRMKKSHKEGTGNCAECHITRKPEELLTISKIGLSFEDTNDQLCGRCHKKTFSEWRGSRFFRDEKGCISCHTATEGKGGEIDERYYHTGKGSGEFGRQMMRPSLMLKNLTDAVFITGEIVKKADEINLLLIAVNKGVGHNIPTGARNSKLFLKLAVTDQSGKVLTGKEVEIGNKDYPPLFSGRETYFEIDIPFRKKGKHNVEISLHFVEKGRRGEGGIVIFKEIMPVEKAGCPGCPGNN